MIPYSRLKALVHMHISSLRLDAIRTIVDPYLQPILVAYSTSNTAQHEVRLTLW